LDEKWIGLSQFETKIELLVMGALAVLGGTVHLFRQL